VAVADAPSKSTPVGVVGVESNVSMCTLEPCAADGAVITAYVALGSIVRTAFTDEVPSLRVTK